MNKRIFDINSGIKEIERKLKVFKRKPVVIGIAGGSGSGKSYIAHLLSQQYKAKILSMDDYYIGIENMKEKNFDIPEAIDLKLLKYHLISLHQRKRIKKPLYDFKTHKRKGYEWFKPSRIIILEGLFSLHESLRDKIDIGIFIDAPENTRLKRRIKRDIKERGRKKKDIIHQWYQTVKPMYKKYVEPQKRTADIVILNPDT